MQMRWWNLWGWLVLAVWVQAGSVDVRVENPPVQGALVALLFDSADAFADLRDPLRTLMWRVGDAEALRFEGLEPGRYAVMVFHDRNTNGVLDQNFMGIPREPLGFSRRYWAKGPPAFSGASIEVAEGGVVPVEIELRSIFPRRGLVGVGAGAVVQSSPYRGADQVRVQAIPAVTYIGQRVQILGPLAQVGLVSRPQVRLAATARYRLGAYRQKDSEVLAGMGNRRDSLFAGLALQAPLPAGMRISAGYEHDVLARVGGGFGRVGLRRGVQWGRVSVVPGLGLNWLTAELAGHEYGIKTPEAREGRPAYRPGAAVNVEPGLGISAEAFGGWRVMLNGSVEFLARELRNSPLVDESVVWRGFMAVNYTF